MRKYCGAYRGGPLDWIKLPSYKTKVTAGRSSGAKGDSNIDDKLLGELRAKNISDIVKAYRPRVVLADHTPQGKHKELIPSLSVSPETVRVLGIRAVVGEVGKVWSDFSAEVFKDTYSNLLWYGDSSVSGGNELERLADRYGVQPHEAGYVSRLAELRILDRHESQSERLAGVISIPWSGEGTAELLQKLAAALSGIDSSSGKWKIYMNLREPGAREAMAHFTSMEHVIFAQVGPQFLDDLGNSRCAVIYGGYNSLTDVMACGVPSLVLLRGMKDGEQEEHAAVLAHKSSVIQDVFSDQEVGVEQLRESLQRCLEAQRGEFSVNLKGAENAARYLAGLCFEAAGGKHVDR